jgi:indolepyruvate ferredoxin oxidoreductase beta subunit
MHTNSQSSHARKIQKQKNCIDDLQHYQNLKTEFNMKNDIIIAGVGGQGILSIAAIIATAAVNNNLYIKQSEIHGMSQRGGEVESHLRISSTPIASDLIPTGAADMIISLEPMEALRYMPWLKPEGWIITNNQPFLNIPNYPPINDILNEIKKIPHHIMMNADEIARELGSEKAANMVVLGAATRCLDIPYEEIEKAIRHFFGRKGEEIVNMNLSALAKGREIAILKLEGEKEKMRDEETEERRDEENKTVKG